jgi:cephalosporin hydroxylase
MPTTGRRPPWLFCVSSIGGYALGEYIIVEDSIVEDLFDGDRIAHLEGGPRLAIAQFLRERGEDYEIDTRLCDYFGANVTWNVNGYVCRVG